MKTKFYKIWWVWAIVFLIFVISAVFLLKINNKVQSTEIQPDVLKVGRDISKGEYILFGNNYAFYEITTDGTDDPDSIIAIDVFWGATRYITFCTGQYVKIGDAQIIPVEKAPILKFPSGIYPEGMYKVGRDIDPGEYILIPYEDSSYIEILSNSFGISDSVIYRKNFSGEKDITIEDGQYIKLVECYIKE